MYLKEILKAVGVKSAGIKNIKIRHISTDSRILKKGDLFIALKGDRFDGHNFVDNAIKKGACCVVINRRFSKTNRKPAILVEDTLRALGDIARYHRMKFDTTVIAITGSAGKTIVKEIVSHILSRKYHVLKNDGTKNNLIGLPMTLFKLKKSHSVCVLEMGTNRPGEIKRLADIARPQIGIITNIGPSHLKRLKTAEYVFNEKNELLKSLSEESLAVVNIDDKFLKKSKPKGRVLYFGVDTPCDFRATGIITRTDSIEFKCGRYRFRVKLLGRYNVYNAMVGIVIGKVFGLNVSAIAKLLDDFRNPFGNRLSLYHNGHISILDDTYNSNPLSFKCAIDAVRICERGKRKIVVTGDMLELGKTSKILHKQTGKHIAEAGMDVLMATGQMAPFICRGAISGGMKRHKVMCFTKQSELLGSLPSVIHKGDTVLVKGSRGTEMDKSAEFLKKFRFA